MFKPSSNWLTDRSKAVLLLLILFVIFVSCHTVLSVPCSLVVTCWERADLLAHLYGMFSCVFVTFPYGVLGHLCYLIVWIPELCIPSCLLHNIKIQQYCALCDFIVSKVHISPLNNIKHYIQISELLEILLGPIHMHNIYT